MMTNNNNTDEGNIVERFRAKLLGPDDLDDLDDVMEGDESLTQQTLLEEFQNVSQSIRLATHRADCQTSDLRELAYNILTTYKEVALAEAESRARVAEALARARKPN